jgi:glycosyltransferase involved in cell wall biosynthesis
MASERRRVLFLVPSFAGGGGGAERIVATLLSHLDGARFDLHLAIAQERSSFWQHIPANVPVHELQLSRMRYALPSIVRLAWRLRPQVIMSTVVYLNVLLLLARPFLPRRTRILVEEVTAASAFVRQDSQRPRLWTWLYRRLYPKADMIICLSEFIKNDLITNFGVPPEKLARIYGPIEVDRLRQLANSENPYGGTKRPTVVAAGRFSREKGFDVLLEAAAAIAGAIPNLRLVILGEGPLQRELKEQAGRLGLDEQVSFAGFQENPWTYFRHADVFIMPSRYEGLGIAVLETLAVGTAVIATDCPGGIREIQERTGGVTLVPAENPAALAQAVITFLKETGIQPRSAANQPRMDDFDLPQSIAAYTELLR